ncbi:MAG: aminodeoxychorismate/anthranilate synthase component II [Peptococcaceae bacterium]|jgi:anthranilate synthase component 2|nr:aminodeoxychorismate/anthranilate synthase component II [Peptococcaceae bacterium]
MILLIDNYDSFSYNLYQLLGSLHPDILVVRNDRIAVQNIAGIKPTHIVLSPGPGKPAGAGICELAVQTYAPKIPILGVCLGHQAICEAFGGTVTYAKTLMHGKSTQIRLDPSCPLFAGLPEQILGARYHSLSLKEATLPAVLKITARSGDGEVMGVQHREFSVYGLQFHPESVLTPDGLHILKNFLQV